MLNFLSHRQGFSSVEFLLTAFPILLLGLASYEMTRWYNTRHVLNLALVEAARSASVHHAKPEEIEFSFENALNPLFVGKGHSSRQRTAYLQKVEQITQQPAWKIQQQSPTHAHFIDFHRDDLAISKATGYYAIDNNYQKEQHARKGKGLLSQETIYEANTLSLSLSYAYEPIVPGMKALFKQMRYFYSDPHSYALLSHGFLPIQHKIAISMQSHPVQWPSTANVITSLPNPNIRPIRSPNSRLNTSDTCYGIWCHSSRLSPNQSSQPTTHPPSNLPNSSSTQPSTDSHDANGYIPPIEAEPTMSERYTLPTNNPSPCGISLCCR